MYIDRGLCNNSMTDAANIVIIRKPTALLFGSRHAVPTYIDKICITEVSVVAVVLRMRIRFPNVDSLHKNVNEYDTTMILFYMRDPGEKLPCTKH